MDARPGRSTADAFLERHPELRDEDLTSDAALALTARLMAPVAAWFRFSLTGWEHLPRQPCVIVANHSIASPFVLPLLAGAWHRHRDGRTVRDMMHRLAWQFPFRQLGVLQALGGLYAHPDVARAAVARGHSLLVFPGGDVDAMRPFSQRSRPDFDGRTGFVRFARAEKLPIVPLAIAGSHAAYVSLPGTGALARALRLSRWTGLKRFPLTLGLVGVGVTAAAPPLWGLLPLALLAAAVPLPTRIDARFLPARMVDEAEADDAAAERVRADLEAVLRENAAARVSPWG